jgi:putative glutamine amidotransferase
MARPVIGISAAIEPARWGPWDAPATILSRSYADRVQASGAVPMLLPPGPVPVEAPDDVLAPLDALVLSGGADIDPTAYGAARHPETRWMRPERDRAELALARRALALGLPMLGICRGMQLLNVATGGTLVQHLPDELGHNRHQPTPGTFSEHDVRLEPVSLAARAAGAERVTVKSHHHQGVDELGEGIVATGWSEPDGIVEAIELADNRFVLGVLWHPEESQPAVLASLIEASARPPER